MRFQKKPVVVDAWQVMAQPGNHLPDWLITSMLDGAVSFQGGRNHHFAIKVADYKVHASKGDWIIRGARGELSVCADEIFRSTYEPILERSPDQCTSSAPQPPPPSTATNGNTAAKANPSAKP